MDYYSILELSKEPFSNSPDPEFFFQSRQHQSCLQRLELALRLKRGLNVVIGDVGTGKTTLCRQLIRKFADDPDIETHLILDPDFSSPEDLLRSVASIFENEASPEGAAPSQLKERIKQALFQRGVDQKKTVVLIIDEGQKIPGPCLEPLREFLNYETNEHKLLQIALFAQPEFEKMLAERPNFADRINLKHILGPMNFRDTRDMIRFRLRRSSEAGRKDDLFTLAGLWAIYRATGGYPRRIVHLCHQCILAVIIQNRRRAGWALVRSCHRRSQQQRAVFGLRPALVGALALFAVVAIAALPPIQTRWLSEKPAPPKGPDALTSKTGTVSTDRTPEAPAADGQTSSPASGEIISAGETSTAAPSETVAPDAPEARVPAASPPEYLGTVVLQDRETLWRLVQKVYGVFEPDYLAAILEANPQISEPNRLEVGTGVRVPAIPVKPRPSARQNWWLRLGEQTSLSEAVEAIRRHPKTMPPARIVPHWHPVHGLSFSILLQEAFQDEAAAEYEQKRLAISSNADAELLPGWEDGTVFYADPHRSG